MTVALTRTAPAARIECLRNDLFDLCYDTAELEEAYRKIGWLTEANLVRQLFEALEDRMTRPYPLGEAPSSSLSYVSDRELTQ
jgi:hypothetical protein